MRNAHSAALELEQAKYELKHCLLSMLQCWSAMLQIRLADPQLLVSLGLSHHLIDLKVVFISPCV